MSLYCPNCERPLEGHDAGHCARRISRRWFFGLCAGAAAAIAAPEGIIDHDLLAKISYREMLELAGLDPRILRAGDRLAVTFLGDAIEPARVCVVAEIEESGEKRFIEAVADVGQQFYIAPQRMRITGFRWSAASDESCRQPSISVVRG